MGVTEVGVVLDLNERPILWHLPEDRTLTSLPDSPDLWQFIWDNRDRISGIAHSHPWYGDATPSHEDVTTFAAIERALGKRLRWWVVTFDRIMTVNWFGPGDLDYGCIAYGSNPEWVAEIREKSKWNLTKQD